MSPRQTPLLLAALIAGFPLNTNAQSTERTIVEQRTETTSRDDQHSLFEKVGWELATADDGVRIERISKNSAAAAAHLEEKDVITKVAGENVASADRVATILTDLRDKGETKTDVVVLREGEELSYLLSLEHLEVAERDRTTSTTVQESQELVAMIHQLQLQVQQQQQLLEMVLTEVQTLRTQMGGVPATRVNPAAPAPGTQVNGDIVAPLSPVGGVTTPGTGPANTNQTTQPPAGRNPRR